MILSLGPTPLANAFPRDSRELAAAARYPLDLFYCDDCTLVQVVDVIDPGVLFSDYIYVTGTSDTMAAHNGRYAAAVDGMLNLGPNDLVVEVASNDGSLLKRFADLGVRILGVEPARNLAELAAHAGIPTSNRFFDLAAARDIVTTHGRASAVIANNVLAHVDDPVDFLSGCGELLDPHGLVVIEVPSLAELADRGEYDTIYHEHLSYFSVTTMRRLCERAGLSIRRIDRLPVHGGSLRVYAASEDSGPHSADVDTLVEEEEAAQLTSFARWERFANEVAANRQALVALLRMLRSDGHDVAAYGAPAKASTLLNYCGIGTDLVSFTVDKNLWKVGRLIPGVGVPVLPVAALFERRPDFALILAWNFADEIIAQQRPYRDAGGRFILPVPEPRIVS